MDDKKDAADVAGARQATPGADQSAAGGASTDPDTPFRAVIEASPIPFAINDADQNITYLNPAFVQTFGYTRRDIPTLADWWPRAYPDPGYRAWVAAQWVQRLEEAQRTGAPFAPMEIVIRAMDGSLHNVIAYAAGLGDELSGTHLVVLYDVTTERRLAEEQRMRQEQLMQAQRLESVGRLAGGVAHDFNTMLGVIIGRADIALKGLLPSDERRAHLLEIRDAAQRSAELTRQLLAYARRQPASPRVIDLNEAITSSIRILKLIVGESVELRWIPGRDVWPVKVDPSQLDQILTNLCANARDAIADVGEVTIRTQNVALRDASFAARVGLATGDYAVIEVRDDGAGIEPSVMPHIFEPFFTTKPAGHGSGLGLSMVYGIARQNEGAVIGESTAGRGSVFEVFLPRYAGEAEPSPPPARAAEAPRGSETVLLVDDEPAMLNMATVMLESLGYTVLIAGSADEAMRVAERHTANIDLLITDLVMPGMNGRDLADRLLRKRPGLRRLFVSGYPDDVIAVRSAVEARAHFLAKPFSLDDLAAMVRAALREDA